MRKKVTKSFGSMISALSATLKLNLPPNPSPPPSVLAQLCLTSESLVFRARQSRTKAEVLR
jgi:hypothetical protein